MLPKGPDAVHTAGTPSTVALIVTRPEDETVPRNISDCMVYSRLRMFSRIYIKQKQERESGHERPHVHGAATGKQQKFNYKIVFCWVCCRNGQRNNLRQRPNNNKTTHINNGYARTYSAEAAMSAEPHWRTIMNGAENWPPVTHAPDASQNPLRSYNEGAADASAVQIDSRIARASMLRRLGEKSSRGLFTTSDLRKSPASPRLPHTMRECILIHLGQAGVQVGNACCKHFDWSFVGAFARVLPGNLLISAWFAVVGVSVASFALRSLSSWFTPACPRARRGVVLLRAWHPAGWPAARRRVGRRRLVPVFLLRDR